MARLPFYQRMAIGLAVDVLRQAVARSAKGRADTLEVRLALWCLVPHCPARWPLDLFWDAAAQENDIGRAQGLTAAFNGVARQLRAAGRYVEVVPEPGTRR